MGLCYMVVICHCPFPPPLLPPPALHLSANSGSVLRECCARFADMEAEAQEVLPDSPQVPHTGRTGAADPGVFPYPGAPLSAPPSLCPGLLATLAEVVIAAAI